jgi:glucan phosphoethanolaminetransferase (alkaline phosphatase superfamily)
VVIVEELLAVGFGFATMMLLYASITLILFSDWLRERWGAKAVMRALAACSLALYAMAFLAAFRSWMRGGSTGTWSDLARGAFYSALASTIFFIAAAVAGWVERRLERASPEAAKRFQKAFLIAFIASAIAAMAAEMLRR